jgi:hypothetical protein
MAIPASVIPSGNSYSVHVAGPGAADSPESDALAVAAASAAALLKIHKVDVRQHLAGDDARARAYRDFLTRGGTKTSAFSPAPAPGAAGEGFWKTTVAVVSASGNRDFWWPPRAEKKVEWEPLLIALCDARGGIPGIPPAQFAAPDLWIVASGDAGGTEVLREWERRDCGAAAVLGPTGIAWSSRNAAFGNAAGSRPFAEAGPVTEFSFGCFAGGVVAGLIEELLGENAFDKSIVRVERAELEARPLHVGKVAAWGGAAARAAARPSPGETPRRLLHKDGDLLGRVRAIRHADDPDGPAKPWGSKGR